MEDEDVRYVCCNNDVEHEAFEMLCYQEMTGIKLEYIVPHKPQQNSQVKWKFAMLYNKI